MNSFEHSWNRLAATARAAAEREPVSPPPAAWVTRVAALGAAEHRCQREQPAWLTWSVPGLGVAMLVAALAAATWGQSAWQSEAANELAKLADPFAGGSLLP